MERLNRLMKLGIAMLLMLLAVLQFRLWSGNRGWPEVRRLEAALTTQREENTRLETRNLRFAAELHNLKKGLDVVEERARSELGMIGRDEVLYQLVDR